MLVLLIAILLLMLYVFLIVEQNDIFAPSVIVTATFLASSVAALLLAIDLNIDISGHTLFVLILGVLLIGLSSHLFNGNAVREKTYKPMVIKVSTSLGVGTLILFMVLSLLYYRSLQRVLSGIWERDWTTTMFRYRQLLASVDYANTVRLPGHVRVCVTAMQSMAMVLAVIVTNNLVNARRIVKSDIPLYISIALYMVTSILTAGRFNMMRMVLALCVCTWFAIQDQSNWSFKISLKNFSLFVLLLIAMLSLFYLSKGLAGRPGQSRFVDDFSLYLGGSILNFNTYMTVMKTHATVFGQETFKGLISLLYRITSSQRYNFSFQLEHQYINDFYVGNVYTAFRAWLHDFSYPGFIFMALFHGYAFARMYSISKNTNIETGWLRAVYSYLFADLVILFIQDQFLTANLTIGGIIILFTIAVYYKLVIASSKVEIVSDNYTTKEMNSIYRYRHTLTESSNGC